MEPKILTFIWQPVINPLHIFAIAALLGILALGLYLRSLKQHKLNLLLLTIRLTVIAALVGLLMGPSAAPKNLTKKDQGEIYIMVDTSRSMLTKDCQDKSRLDYARENWLNEKFISELKSAGIPKIVAFDEVLTPKPAQIATAPADKIATGRQTLIAQCMSQLINQMDHTDTERSIVMISDGHCSEESNHKQIARLARNRGIPIHTISLGGPTIQKDLILVAIPNQQYLLANKKGSISVELHQIGFDKIIADAEASQKPLQITLTQGDKKTTTPIYFNKQRSAKIEIPVEETSPGQYEYQISVATLPGELEASNNTQKVFQEVTDKKISVLVLEGQPHWDTKFISQSLRKDPRVEITQITRVTPKSSASIITTSKSNKIKIPSSLKDFAKYDVIIVGRCIENVLSMASIKLLPDYIASTGGYLVFSRGKSYDTKTATGRSVGRELSAIEPVVWGKGGLQNQSFKVTPAGLASFLNMGKKDTSLLETRQAFKLMPVVARCKTATVILAETVPANSSLSQQAEYKTPGIVSMNYGAGRVIGVLGEGLWNWQMMSPAIAKQFKHPIYEEFWSKLIGWLAMGSDFLPGHEVALSLGSSSVKLGETQLVEVSLKKADPEFKPVLKLQNPAGKIQKITLTKPSAQQNSYQASIPMDTPGVYTLTLETPGKTPAKLSRKFNVYDTDFERLNVAANPNVMREIANASGGKFLTLDQMSNLTNELKKLSASRQKSARPAYIWDQWLILVVLLGWAGAEWIIRKKVGLL